MWGIHDPCWNTGTVRTKVHCIKAVGLCNSCINEINMLLVSRSYRHQSIQALLTRSQHPSQKSGEPWIKTGVHVIVVKVDRVWRQRSISVAPTSRQNFSSYPRSIRASAWWIKNHSSLAILNDCMLAGLTRLPVFSLASRRLLGSGWKVEVLLSRNTYTLDARTTKNRYSSIADAMLGRATKAYVPQPPRAAVEKQLFSSSPAQQDGNIGEQFSKKLSQSIGGFTGYRNPS